MDITSIFLQLINQLNSSIFVLITLLFVLFFLVYKAGSMTQTFASFNNKHMKFDDAIDRIKDLLSKIQATTDLLYQMQLTTVQSHSPLGLSEKGHQVAIEIAAEEKINSHWDTIKARFNLASLSNPYDIQTQALDLAVHCFDSIFTEEERTQIKTYAFNMGMNLLEVYPVLGIKIRDKIFEELSIDLKESPQLLPGALVVQRNK